MESLSIVCLRLQNLTANTLNGSAIESPSSLALLCQRLLLSTGGGGDQRDFRRHTRDLVTYYLMGVAGVTVCCFGLVGNFLSLLVLTRRNMHTSTYCYLAALAVCDLLVDVCTVTLLVKDVQMKPTTTAGQNEWRTGSGGYYPYLFPYLHPAAFTFQVCSVWLTLAFTVDRYIMICHPFRSESFCSVERARRVVGGIIVGAAAFNLPKFFEYRTVFVAHLLDGVQVVNVGCDLTPFGRSRLFKELYHSWLYTVFVFALPFVSLAVLNSFLVHAVRMSRRRGRDLNPAEVRRMDTTVMLIGVVVVFVVCQLPAMLSRIAWAVEDNPKAFVRLPLFALNEVGNFLIILNSSVNIVPYYFFGQKFRKEFLRLFCSCFCRRNAKHTISWSAGRRDSRKNY